MEHNAKVIVIKCNRRTKFMLLFSRIVFFILMLNVLINLVLSEKKVRLMEIIGSMTNSNISYFIMFGTIAIVLLLQRFSIEQLLEDLPALTITDKELLYHHSDFFVSKSCVVEWIDVVAITETETRNQKLINLIVKNPQKNIKKQKGLFKKILMRINLKTFGAVISISSNSLQCSHEELKFILDQKFDRFIKRQSSIGT